VFCEKLKLITGPTHSTKEEIMAKKKAAAKKAAPKKAAPKKAAPKKAAPKKAAPKKAAPKKAAPAASAGRGPGRPKIKTSMEVLRALEAAIASADKLKERLEAVLKKAEG
jgi:hypothetical protein